MIVELPPFTFASSRVWGKYITCFHLFDILALREAVVLSYTFSGASVEHQHACEWRSQYFDLVNLFGRYVITVMFPSEYKDFCVRNIVMVVIVAIRFPPGAIMPVETSSELWSYGPRHAPHG